MATLKRPRRVLSAVILGSLLVLTATPANAAKIPERFHVPAGITSVVHVRIDSGCGPAPTDYVEVSMPRGLSQVMPEAIPGWTVETDAVAQTDGGERVSSIRWTGGSVPDGQFMDFGFRALFPDEPGEVLSFPVIQRCGTLETAYTGAEGERAAPFVQLGPSIRQDDLVALVASVDGLLVDVERIQEQVASVRSPALRDRVDDIETSGAEIVERITALRERIKALEDSILPDPGL